MEKTVIDWLAEKIFSEATFIAVANNEDELAIEVSVIKKILKQAKEMEKQQIIEASNESFLNSGLVKRRVKNKKVFSVGEQYYNETFKSE